MSSTPPNRLSARAPGKLLIAGEFAVLEGAPALVIAINRHARATLVNTHLRSPPTPSPLHQAVAETLQVSADELEYLQIDTSDLFQGGRKLGLGSSSAACVAAVAALGDTSQSRDHLFEQAINAHRRFQAGLGSGFDVAASTYGGALIYTLGTRPLRVDLPVGIFWRAFLWGRPSSTHRAIERWRVVRDHKSLVDAALKLPQSVQSSATNLLSAIDNFQQRLMELDRAHALGIATEAAHLLAARAQEIATAHGASVLFKQSGAGGGDVSIAISTSVEALQAFSDIAVQSGLQPLALEIDMHGAVRD